MAIDCSELARGLYELTESFARRGYKTLDEVVEQMRATGIEVDKQMLANTIVEVGVYHRLSMEAAIQQLDAAKPEIKRIEQANMRGIKKESGKTLKLTHAIEELRDAIKNKLATVEHKPSAIDTLKAAVREKLGLQPKEPSPPDTKAVKALQAELEEVTRIFNESAPVMIAKYATEMEEVNRYINEGGSPIQDKMHRMPEEQAVQEAHDKLKQARKVLREINSDRAATPRLQRRIAELEKHLADGTLPEKLVKGQRATPDPNTVYKQKLAALDGAIRASDPAIRVRIEKNTAGLLEKLRSSDFAKPLNTEAAELSPELLKRANERDLLRKVVNRKVAEAKPKTAVDAVSEVIKIHRNLVTSGDGPPAIRQGLVFTLGHPIKSAALYAKAIRAMVSPQAHAAAVRRLSEVDGFQVMVRDKLNIRDDTDINNMSEEFQHTWLKGELKEYSWKNPLKYIKLVLTDPSERAFNTYMNGVRVHLYKALEASAAKGGKFTRSESLAAVNIVNGVTGDVNFGQHAPTVRHMNLALFSTNYLISRAKSAIDMVGIPATELASIVSEGLGGQELKLYGGKRVRRAVAKEYVRSAMGMMTVLTANAWATSEDQEEFEEKMLRRLNPTSPEFMKFEFNGTLYDMSAGYSSLVKPMSQITTGVRRENDGSYTALAGDDVKFGRTEISDVAFNAIRGKLNVPAGVAWDLLSKKTVNREKVRGTLSAEVYGREDPDKVVSAAWVVGRALVPFTYGDIAETIESEKVPEDWKKPINALLYWSGGSGYTPDERVTRKK